MLIQHAVWQCLPKRAAARGHTVGTAPRTLAKRFSGCALPPSGGAFLRARSPVASSAVTPLAHSARRTSAWGQRQASTTSPSMSEQVNVAKRAAGYRAVEDNLKADFRYVGIGSGSTVIFCVERIAQLRDTLPIDQMYFVPTGYQSKQLIAEAQLPMMEIDQFSANELDIVFDGADEVDEWLQCIKGGGACLLQEKLVGKCSKKWVCVADASKLSKRLGEKWTQGVPIEVVPFAHKKVAVDLARLGAKRVTMRGGGKAKAGPIVTDNGNFVLDVDFGQIPLEQVVKLDQRIKELVGVVEVGLFDYADSVYIGTPEGEAKVLHRNPKIIPNTYGVGPLDGPTLNPAEAS